MRGPIGCVYALLAAQCGCADVFKDSGESDTAVGGGGGGASGGADGAGRPTTVDCDAAVEPPTGTCPSTTLACGDSLVSSNADAETTLDGRHYSSAWACAVVGDQSYRGPEQVIEFTHPGTGDVTVRLDSPCADLDLFVARWEDGCLSPGNAVVECEGVVQRGGGSVTIWNNERARYLIIVDGPADQQANFGLSLQCPAT